MQWNPLVPELSVSDFAKSLRLYTEGIGFAVQYTRDNPSFAYLDLGGAQIMIEQDHPDGWSTGALESPRGRGINLQIEVPDVNAGAHGCWCNRSTSFASRTTAGTTPLRGAPASVSFWCSTPMGT